MSVQQGIRDAWSCNATLTALVPDTLVIVGDRRQDGKADFPYVTLKRSGTGRVENTSDNVINTMTVQMTVYDSDYDRGLTITRAAIDYFSRARFPYDRGAVLNMKPANQREAKAADGTWTHMIDWTTIAVEAKAAYPVGV